MIKITDIQKQVIDKDDKELKRIFKTVLDAKLEDDERTGRKTWWDSDLEDIQYALEEYGIHVTWQALDKFFSDDYDENEYTLKGKELDLYLAHKQKSKYDDFDADEWNSKF